MLERVDVRRRHVGIVLEIVNEIETVRGDELARRKGRPPFLRAEGQIVQQRIDTSWSARRVWLDGPSMITVLPVPAAAGRARPQQDGGIGRERRPDLCEPGCVTRHAGGAERGATERNLAWPAVRDDMQGVRAARAP